MPGLGRRRHHTARDLFTKAGLEKRKLNNADQASAEAALPIQAARTGSAEKLDHVFQRFEREDFNDFTCWFSFEHHFRAGERIHAFARFGRRFGNHFNFH